MSDDSKPFSFGGRRSPAGPRDTREAAVPEADTAGVATVAPDEHAGVAASGDEAVPAEAAEAQAPVARAAQDRWVWGVAAVASVALVLAFLSWRQAENDPDRHRAALRDQAVLEGARAVAAINTLDFRDLDAGLKRWQDVSTGVLHDQFVTAGPEQRELLAEAGKVTEGRVVAAALTDLTDSTATMLASIEVSVGTADESIEPTVKRNRYAADLVLVDGVWKVENLQQVRVNV